MSEEGPTLAEIRALHRDMRHDIRGALSPALLMADRLLGHSDPKVHRAAEIIVSAVERATALLARREADER